MTYSTRRARRAVAVFALAGCAATVGAVVAPASAGASSTQPAISVRVRQRVLLVEAGSADDLITLRVPAINPFVVEVDLGDDGTADATVDRGQFDSILVRAGDGADVVRIDETAGAAVPFTDVIPTTIEGQGGDDVLLGGSGAEHFSGGRGNDVVDGNRGNDTASLDTGDDEFIWDPGDGSDTIDGRTGHDVMTFNGAGGNENFAAVANGSLLRFTRNVGNIVMDTDDVEQVDLNALGGSDFVEIDDLSATDVTAINVDEGTTLGAAGADGIVDSVFVDGTEDADAITLAGSAGAVTIGGLATTVTVTDADTIDRLLVSSLGGDDVVDASALGADTMFLSVLAGDGDDAVLGGQGAETVLAGDGNDFVDGNRGNDTADLEAGDDEFLWDPGDGSDIVEGREGDDLMTFNGSGGAEIFAAFPLGERLAFTRNLGNIFMDTADVERIDLNALGGADTLTIEDVTGTDLAAFRADLGAAIGAAGGDGAVDAITMLGTPGDDIISVSGAAGNVSVIGLATTLDISDSEPTDTLAIVGDGGTDTVDSAGLAPGTIGLTVS